MLTECLLNTLKYAFGLKSIISISLILLLIPSLFGNAQQYDNWYFGRHAALNFSTSTTVPVPAVLNNSAMVADEAAASISGRDGKLLFYTNGVTVYNKLHQVMLNGDNLSGNVSSCQVLIVPVPGNDSLYYIFTTDAVEHNFQSGYRYSLVNINRDNGKGEVITKNILLWGSCTERLSAARHANGVDTWVITNDNNSNVFRAWLINCNGLQTTEVISTTGEVLNQFRDINTGVIKISPDGKLLCQTHFPIVDEIIPIPNFIQLFDFNSATGVISTPRKIGFPDAQYTHGEFSPDSKLLYLTRPYEKKMDQLETTLPTVAAILTSRVTIPTTAGYYDIQLAPDERIYCSRLFQSIAVINQPDIKGINCDFREDQVQFTTGSAYIGLPSHINDIVATNDPNNGFTYTIIDSCTGTVQFNGYSNLAPGPVNYEWDFGDGTNSGSQNQLHRFSPAAAVYTVSLKISTGLSCPVIYKSKRIRPSGTYTGKPLFSFISRCDSGYTRFINLSDNLAAVPGRVSWDFGDGSFSSAIHPVHVYALPGTYQVKLKISAGLACLDDSISLPVTVKDFIVDATPDQTIRVGQSVFLSTSDPAFSFTWTPTQWLSNPNTRSPVATPLDDITYKVSGTSGDGCTGEDSVRIHVLQYDDIYVPNGFTPDDDGINDIIRPFFSHDFVLEEFSIYNRWGLKVFSTSRRGDGWNGRINNRLQGSGAYAWYFRAVDKSGNRVERKGVVVLIK